MGKTIYALSSSLLLGSMLLAQQQNVSAAKVSPVHTEKVAKSDHVKKQADVITFKDQALSKIVKQALSLSDDQPVTTENILGLTKLVTDGEGITDLSGLEYATNLTTVTFSNEKITSLKPLSGLKKLYSAGFSNNTSLPMSAVLSLKNLTQLELSGIKYDQGDFDKLSQFSRMTYLKLNDCELQNLAFAASMPDLGVLYANNNNISSLKPLENCSKLNGVIAINNKITSLEGINSSNLAVVDLNQNDVESLNDANMPNVKSIQLIGNKVTNVDLTKYQALNTLNLYQNPVESVNADDLPTLEHLSLGYSNLKNVDFLSHLPNVLTLSLEGSTNISSLNPISHLTKVTELYLNHMSLTSQDVKAIGTMPSVDLLALNSNKLKDVSFISLFSSVQHLAVSSNSITDLNEVPDGIECLAVNQTIDLPDTTVNTPTPLVLRDANGNIPVSLKWNGEGELAGSGEQQKIIWKTTGNNSLNFDSDPSATGDVHFSGTINQKVS